MPLARSMLNLPKFSFKAVRVDCESECEGIDKSLCEAGGTIVKLPAGVPEDVLAEAVSDADLLLVSHTPVTAHAIENAKKLKGIVKYGVGIDNIEY